MNQQFYFWVYTQKNWKLALKRQLYTHIHSSIIHTGQKAEAPQMGTFGWKDKQNMLYAYSTIQP